MALTNDFKVKNGLTVIDSISAGGNLSASEGFFDSDVGIGTNNPSGELHVKNVAELYTSLAGSDAAVNFVDSQGDVWRAGIRAADNSFRFTQDATSLNTDVRVTIADGGNVGIGKTNPSSKLYIGTYGSSINSSTLPTTPANHLITLTPPSTTNYYGGGIGWSEGTNVAASINAYDAGSGGALGLVFSTGNNTTLSEALRIDSAGKVGIGTTTPSSLLHINAADGVMVDTYTAYIRNQEATAGDNFGLGIQAGSNSSDVSLQVSDKAGTSLLRVRGDGNVGIGTNSPAKKLEVNVGGTSSDGILVVGSLNPHIEAKDSTNSVRTVIASEDSLGKVGTISSTDLKIVTGNSERIRVDTSGNVGIGTTSADAKLDITQTSATEPVLRLTDDGVANYDFIFPDTSTIKLETSTASNKTFKLLNAGSGDFNFEASNATFAGNISTTGNILSAGVNIDQLFGTSGGGDITAVTTGPYLTGGGASGSVEVGIDSACAAAWDAAVAGDISAVVAGTGLTGGGNSGSVTLNISAGDGVQATANCVSVDSTVVRTTGTQSIGGSKTFTSDICIANKIIHDGDSNTFFQLANDIAVINTGGEEHLRANNSGIVINEGGLANDFRVEGDTDTHALFVDGSKDNVGIGTSSTENNSKLTVTTSDTTALSTLLRVGSTSANQDYTALRFGNTTSTEYNDYGFSLNYEGTQAGNNNRFVWYADNQTGVGGQCIGMSMLQDGKVGIGKTTPGYQLDVAGDIGLDGTLRHNGDADTYITFGSNTIGLYAGGEDAINIDASSTTFNQGGIDRDFRVEGDTDVYALFVEGSTDRVGIGTSTPTRKLDVESADDTVASFNSTDNKASIAINDDDTTVYVSAENAKGAFGFQAGTHANNLNIDSSGNVGIGTTSPSNFTGLSFSDPILDVAGPIQSRTGNVALGGSSYRKAALFTSTGSDAPYLDFRVASSGTSSNTTVRMRIDENGNVGIGTTSPATKLHVAGNSLVTGDSTIYGNLSVTGDFTCLETTVSTTSALSVTNTGTGPALFVCQAGVQPIAHFIDANGDDIVFADDGKVGIGTFNPAEELTVSGTISASEFVYVGEKKAVSSDDINFIVKVTQAEYDALTPDSGTLYIITDESTNSPVVNPITTVTANYTVTDEDHTILTNGSSVLNVGLPSAVTNSNYVYNVKNVSTNAITISAAAGNIDGQSSQAICQQFENITVQSDGSNWFII